MKIHFLSGSTAMLWSKNCYFFHCIYNKKVKQLYPLRLDTSSPYLNTVPALSHGMWS